MSAPRHLGVRAKRAKFGDGKALAIDRFFYRVRRDIVRCLLLRSQLNIFVHGENPKRAAQVRSCFFTRSGIQRRQVGPRPG